MLWYIYIEYQFSIYIKENVQEFLWKGWMIDIGKTERKINSKYIKSFNIYSNKIDRKILISEYKCLISQVNKNGRYIWDLIESLQNTNIQIYQKYIHEITCKDWEGEIWENWSLWE